MRTITNWDAFFMHHVYLASWKSKDPRTKIGSVLVRDKMIFSTGFNGFPRGVTDSKDRYQNRDTKNKLVAHSEFNCILQAARIGVSTLGSVLYTQGIPCHNCAKAVIQAGIKKVIVHKQWPNLIHSKEWVESIDLSKLMFSEAKIDVKFLDCVLNTTGFLDGKIIKV